MVVGVEIVVRLTLESIQVHLAHRADRDHYIRFVLIGRGNQSADQLKGSLRADLGHVTAAAVRIEREIDHFGTQRLEQLVQLGWVLVVRPMVVIVRSG